MCNKGVGCTHVTAFLCDQRSQRYIFGAKNTTRTFQGVAIFNFFRKICKKNIEIVV